MELDYGRECNGQPKPEHPLSLIFPDMTAAEFSDLVKSMRESGFDQAHDILTWCGEVVDGRHRQAAVLEAGVQPRYQSLPAEWTLERVKAMLVKENLLHRNLDESQMGNGGACRVVGVEAARQQHGGEPAQRGEEPEEFFRFLQRSDVAGGQGQHGDG